MQISAKQLKFYVIFKLKYRDFTDLRMIAPIILLIGVNKTIPGIIIHSKTNV